MSLLGKRKKWQSCVELHMFCLTFLAHENRAPGDPTTAAHCTKGGRGVGEVAKTGLAKLRNYAEVRVPSHRDGLHPVAMGTH